MRSILLLLILMPAFIFAACSSGGVTAPGGPSSPDDLIAQDWGNYQLTFDPVTQDVEVVYDRNTSGHLEISAYLNPPACGSGCITAVINSWDVVTHIASFDVSIQNPTNITPRDVRMIFYWLGTKKILNADSYTRAFVGSIEPFIAFGKANPNRTFPGGSTATETVDIYWPPMSPFSLYFKVSAWVWANCRDPYEINNMMQMNGDLYPSGGYTEAHCDVLDWQGDVTGVTVDTTIFNGGVSSMAYAGGNHWQQGFVNAMGVPVGTYTLLITASSPNPQNYDLYNYIDIAVIPQPTGWIPEGPWIFNQGPCSLDFGVIGAVGGGSPVICLPDISNQCSEVWKYPGSWGNIPGLYASLVNLDPGNPAFQPWPVVRIDAGNNGSIGWTNRNDEIWLGDPPFPIMNLNSYCNMVHPPNFIYFPIGDDHRHEALIWQEVPGEPVDCCDSFHQDQCVLYVRYEAPGAVAFQAFQGPEEGFNYTDQDMKWGAEFPSMYVGSDNTQVDPGDIVGIDTMRTQGDDVILVFIAMRVNRRVEVYQIIESGSGMNDTVVYFNTIMIQIPGALSGSPIDIELLPGNDEYEKNPGMPILNVLVDNAQSPPIPPGFGGSVWIFDAITGAFVDMIGDSTAPAVTGIPLYLDTDDIEWSVHVMDWDPKATKFLYVP